MDKIMMTYLASLVCVCVGLFFVIEWMLGVIEHWFMTRRVVRAIAQRFPAKR